MRVLLVEDEAEIGKLVVRSVAARGFAIDHVGSLAEAHEAVRTAPYILILLDRRLPDGDGMSAIAGFRAALPAVPIILLTAMDDVAARVAGLDAGANDYLTKPFALDELQARIRAALRHPDSFALPPCQCGNVSFDEHARAVVIAGEPVVLARRELILLEALILRAGRVVLRTSLADSLYGFDEDLQDNTLDAAVARLRRRLESAEATARIHTARGLGYMLRADPP